MRSSSRPVLFLGLVVLALTGVVGISQWRADHAVDLVPWRSDLTKAEAEAKAQHKPIFAYFTASWCGPCRTLKQTTWADTGVAAAIEKRFVPVKIDVDEHKDLALGYRIESIPTFIILSDAGKPIRQDSGYKDEAAMLEWAER